MIQCKSCRMEHGTNRTCPDCMRALLRDGAKRLDEAQVREAAAKGREWLDSGGGGAPPEVVDKTARLVAFLSDRLVRSSAPGAGDDLALAAFAIRYVLDPRDLAPDHLPGAGWADDLLVAKVALEDLRLSGEPPGKPEGGPAKGRRRK
jgi:hypothetical protein